MKAPQLVIEAAKEKLKKLQQFMAFDEEEIGRIQASLNDARGRQVRQQQQYQQIADWLRSQGESV